MAQERSPIPGPLMTPLAISSALNFLRQPLHEALIFHLHTLVAGIGLILYKLQRQRVHVSRGGIDSALMRGRFLFAMQIESAIVARALKKTFFGTVAWYEIDRATQMRANARVGIHFRFITPYQPYAANDIAGM